MDIDMLLILPHDVSFEIVVLLGRYDVYCVIATQYKCLDNDRRHATCRSRLLRRVEIPHNAYVIHLDGVQHTESDDAPSFSSNVLKTWRRYGKLHRVTGPAWMARHEQHWFVNGRLHREGGLPAIERETGQNEWWGHGVQIK